MAVVSYNSNILTHSGYWLNAVSSPCPASSLVIQFADESLIPMYTAWTNLGTWSQMSTSPNVWLLTPSWANWSGMFSLDYASGTHTGVRDHFSVLKADLTGVSYVYGMFHSNSYLDYCAPMDLSVVSSRDIKHMFCGCTGLTQLPALTLPNNALADYVFSGCVYAENTRDAYNQLAASNCASHVETFAYTGSYSSSPYDHAIPDSWGGANNIGTRPDSYVLRLDQFVNSEQYYVDFTMCDLRVSHVHMTADGDYLPVTGGVECRSSEDVPSDMSLTDIEGIVLWYEPSTEPYFHAQNLRTAGGYLEIYFDLPYPPHDISWRSWMYNAGIWTTLRETLYGVYNGNRVQLAQTTLNHGGQDTLYSLPVTDPVI